MAFLEIVALLRRHIVAVLVVLAVAGAAEYQLRATPPVYVEGGSVVFYTTKHISGVDRPPFRAYLLSQSLIATETTMAGALSPSAAAVGIRTTAGTAQYRLAPFNSHNLQYPYYSLPSATLTVTSQAPAATHLAFLDVFSSIAHKLAAAQSRAAVPAASRIRVYLTADTGTLRQAGSRIRVFGGVAVLTVLVVFMVAGFLDRRLRHAGRRRMTPPTEPPARAIGQVSR
jgi:hypothetical protein